MSRLLIYDKPMCCSTGICGPQVDPVLPRFAGDLEWLKGNGLEVDRWNLSQQPHEFTANPVVSRLLESEGIDCLPIIIVDDRVMSRGRYPSRDQLAAWTGISAGSSILPVVTEDGEDCCGSTGCC